MSDNPSILSSSSGKHTTPIPSLLASKLFVGFSTKAFTDSEAAMSQTSIIMAKPFSSINNPFFPERIHRKPYFNNGDSGAIGLGIVDSLAKENSEKMPFNQSTRIVLFGPQLKIKIPSLQSNSSSPTGSVESPRIEFGIKNKNLQLAMHSPAGLSCELKPKFFTGSLSPREMELSEDYTCVISYGPNPKKTHIFDNYIVESSADRFTASRKGVGFSDDQRFGYPSEDFLSFCHGCKKSLGQGKDIFMYRGERAFCSHECRRTEMMSDDEGTENCFQDLLLDPLKQ